MCQLKVKFYLGYCLRKRTHDLKDYFPRLSLNTLTNELDMVLVNLEVLKIDLTDHTFCHTLLWPI